MILFNFYSQKYLLINVIPHHELKVSNDWNLYIQKFEVRDSNPRLFRLGGVTYLTMLKYYSVGNHNKFFQSGFILFISCIFRSRDIIFIRFSLDMADVIVDNSSTYTNLVNLYREVKPPKALFRCCITLCCRLLVTPVYKVLLQLLVIIYT